MHREAAERLLEWFCLHRRDLPWRRSPSPYRVWVSEVMLQQTQVETVVPYYSRFLDRFPDVESLALAAEDEVLSLWSGLGYYKRARNLHAAARKILEEHAGKFPRDFSAALALPGIGSYTAGAVLSIAYNLPAPVLDGNVERVLTRTLALKDDPRKAASRKKLLEVLQQLIPEGRSSEFNQALMELGALVCLPASPRCDRCPLAHDCAGRHEGKPERYPQKARRRKTVPVHMAAIVVLHDSRVLVRRNIEEKGTEKQSPFPPYLRGLWILPAAEVQDPASGPALLRKILRENWGGAVSVEGSLGTLRHAITFRRITIHAWRGRVLRPPARRRATQGRGRFWRWADPGDLGTRLPVPSLTKKIMKLVE